MDWVKGVLNIPIVYAVELRDTGKHGFFLPTTEIIPTAQETFDAIISILKDNRETILQDFEENLNKEED